MVVVVDKNLPQERVEKIIAELNRYGFDVHKSTGEKYIILGALGVQPGFDIRKIKMLEGVVDVFRITEPYKLASRRFKDEKTIIKVNDIEIGGDEIIIIAGPCAVENENQIMKLAEVVKNNGAKILRGGAFKPRTSPYSFQGLGEEGLKLLRQAGDSFGLSVITEIIELSHFELIEKYTDIFQVGSRNMYNYPLLKILGTSRKPVMLKRGMSATIDEWLMSAEYILSGGNPNVILCERGIRTFDTSLRNTFDISAIVSVKDKTHLPVCADPSHAIGYRDKIIPMARAAVAAGTDALMIEVHHDPDNALSDGPQALLPEQFSELMKQIKEIAKVIEKKF
ncbi:3-deoxy-7-phosphoheptulonate synthase [Ignavibacterium album JCM 16511]|uniref:3-deoxy-7-phosphoheptulonate synthase n=1 Tax=Ignavibacterium album (strain DSM 19864 / JCM 16511 / NBRC 101810 / Mat9-16) TaxID=945713 RepID=I0AJ44_IGNAJ|nr:3-deoxy-7-phosphoheptulonate synthase [Ignavibacterium album]AFH49001.1 3-deoxy-7-phosphoheptulonate synthase [Ignavibacterium album JCM 16511]